jgi:hypothetical protein
MVRPFNTFDGRTLKQISEFRSAIVSRSKLEDPDHRHRVRRSWTVALSSAQRGIPHPRLYLVPLALPPALS